MAQILNMEKLCEKKLAQILINIKYGEGYLKKNIPNINKWAFLK